MRKLRLMMALLLGAAACFGAFAGCDSNSGGQLDIVVAGCYQNNWEKVFMRDEIVSEFEKETGIRVNLETITSTDAISKIKAAGGSAEVI